MKNFKISAVALMVALSSNVVFAGNDQLVASHHETTIDSLVASGAVQNQAVANVTIDVVAFYQPSYAAKMGNQWVHQRIADMVKEANTVLANTGVSAQYRLVKALPITGIPDDLPFESSASLVGADALSSERILSPYGADGGYPENKVYTSFGGDLALYVRDYNASLQKQDIFGYGTLGGELSTVFDKKVIDPNDNRSISTFAHESGHNLNAGHEAESPDAGNFLPEAHAYKCDGRFTIMGPNNGDRHLFFSSPTKVVNGQYCGAAGSADNAKIVSAAAPVAAARRSAPSIAGNVFFDAPSFKLVNGTDYVVLSLTRNGNLSEAAAVEVAMQNGSAKEGTDFTTSIEQVNFSAGQSKATVQVKLKSGATGMASAVLRYPYKLAVGDIANASVVISEPVVGEFGFAQSELAVSEAAGTISLKIKRTLGDDGSQNIRVYTADGSRKSGVDYVALDQVVNFADGETEKAVNLTILDNSIIDVDGDFLVKIDGQGAAVSQSNMKITLTNNDVKAVEPPNNTGKESSGGSMGYSVLLLGALIYARKKHAAYNGNTK